MANVIKEQRLVDNNKRALIKYVATFDTAAANTVLLDASSLNLALNANGFIMSSNVHPKSNYRTTVKRITGNLKANGYVKLQWAGDSNSEIVIITDGRFEYNFDPQGDSAVIFNPEANATGDILISVVAPSATDAMTLFLDLRKDSRDYDAGQTADPVAFNKGPAAFI